MNILKEFATFLWQEKKYWLWPLMIVLFLFGTLMVFTEGSALAPFIYSLF
ncbi:MAG: DUF5989 family protein [Prolixibacteraceae bacterium]